MCEAIREPLLMIDRGSDLLAFGFFSGAPSVNFPCTVFLSCVACFLP